jgi:O-antigen ligase
MMRDHWLFGTGFGSFDAVYRIYEPTALLLPLYVNHAHNDWAQLVIEGGLPAAICLLGLMGWVAMAIWRIARRTPGSGALVVFWTAWLAIMMAASTVDYPLRTPIFQAVSVWLMLCLAFDSMASKAGANE